MLPARVIACGVPSSTADLGAGSSAAGPDVRGEGSLEHLPIKGLRRSNRGKGRHSADVLVPQMPYVQVYATELFSAGHASPPCRRISSPLRDMRAHRVRSRRLRGSPVSLLRVRLQRIHTGRCRLEACGASERRRPLGTIKRSARTPQVDHATYSRPISCYDGASTEVLEPLPEIGSTPLDRRARQRVCRHPTLSAA